LVLFYKQQNTKSGISSKIKYIYEREITRERKLNYYAISQ